jgi:hypothetical protein
MDTAMSAPVQRHTIVCHARPEAFAPGAWVLLCRLGYSLWLTEDYEKRAEDEREDDRPAVRLVDERRLIEVEDEPGWTPTPVVMLTGRHGATGADPRVVAAVRRPAGLHELYRVLQELLETHPRTVPRVPTHVRAICTRSDRSWDVSILSLSENGCLIRSREPLPLETRVKLRFELGAWSQFGPLEIEADTAYQLLPDVGLVFSGLAARERDVLQAFVMASMG